MENTLFSGISVLVHPTNAAATSKDAITLKPLMITKTSIFYYNIRKKSRKSMKKNVINGDKAPKTAQN
jgi:hypothetical protein